MGLSLHTRQDHNHAEIEVRGDVTGLALSQLAAAIEHFRSRGCTIVDVKLVPTKTRTTSQILPTPPLVLQQDLAIRQV